jgi:hypothetical protein
MYLHAEHEHAGGSCSLRLIAGGRTLAEDTKRLDEYGVTAASRIMVMRTANPAGAIRCVLPSASL